MYNYKTRVFYIKPWFFEIFYPKTCDSLKQITIIGGGGLHYECPKSWDFVKFTLYNIL